MSELTNKRLEQIANNERIPVTDPEIGDMARELLALRSRDAGDDEVGQMKGMIRKCIYGIPDSEGKIARDMLDRIVDSYITRGQTRTDAVNKAAEWAKECEGLQEQVATLTSELAALKSAPGMEEVDELLTPWVGQPFKSIIDNFEEMRDLARRSIASREEVVGLLRWLKEFSGIILDEVATFDSEVGHNATRIVEIVEGK